jgi:hypothetical protein
MVLFNEIIEILHLPELTAFGNEPCCFEFVERFGIRSIFVDVDHAWLNGMRCGEGFHKEALGSVPISGWTEKEIERLSLRVNRSIELDPLFFDFDIGFVNAPRVRWRLQMETATLPEVRSIVLDPTINCCVIHM